MHKITLVILGLFVVFATAPAYAATISLTPTTISVKKGETVSISIAVDPQSVKLGVVKVALSFPANILEATAFTLASTDEWLVPPGAGNSVTDNTNGSLIKTAGYLGGFTTTKSFGTATFRAKTDGVATVAVTASSFAYNAQGANTLSGTQGSSAITVATTKAPTPELTPAPVQTTPTAPTPKIPAVETTGEGAISGEQAPVAQEPTTAPQPIASQSMLEGAISGEEAPVAQEPTTAPQPIASQSMLAAVGSIVTLGTDSAIVGILITVIILALIGYAIYAVIQRTRRKNLGKLW